MGLFTGIKQRLMKDAKKSIFIANSRKDNPWALAIYRELAKHGYRVFFDYLGAPSNDFQTTIRQGIESSSHFIVLLSDSTLSSAFIQAEIEWALRSRKNFVPILIEGFQYRREALPDPIAQLAAYNSIRFTAGTFERDVERLRLRFLEVPFAPDDVPASIPINVQEATKELEEAVASAPEISFASCFISFSTRDQDFADTLYKDLRSNGVKCWFAPHDMEHGKKIHEQIHQAILLHDRLLLILSDNSMASNWVRTEISKARKRELAERRQVLFPVRIVAFSKIQEWECFDPDTGSDSAQEIRAYFIPDFSDWSVSEGSYKQTVGKLVQALTLSS